MGQETQILQQTIEGMNLLDFLQQSDKLSLVSFISQFPLAIALFDLNGRFMGVNQKFADIYESDALYLFDKLLSNFSTIVDAQFKEAVALFESEESIKNFEQVFYDKGKFYLSYFKPMCDANNQIQMIMLVCSDVTRLKRRENVLLLNNKKLHDHLYLDSVTNLQNKLAFDHFMSDLADKRKKGIYSFLKIDLNDFKRFNQLHSYGVGDQALGQIGTRLNETIAHTDAKIFRLNSARFVVVIEHLTEWAVLTLAERLKFVIADQRILFEQGKEEHLTASIGIYHVNIEQGFTEVNILNKLDEAVRHAKLLGKNSLYILKNP